MNNSKKNIPKQGRRYFLLLTFVAVAIGLLGKVFHIQINPDGVLQAIGRTHKHDIKLPGYRGMITDRNHELLAVSAPAYAACINPQQFNADNASVTELIRILQMEHQQLYSILHARRDKQFAYIKRQITQDQKEQIVSLSIPGVHLEQEQRRFYPMGEVTAHLIGVTDTDSRGVEGIEKAFNESLQGYSGRKRVLRDRRNRSVRDIAAMEPPQSGKRLVLSIDRRIQYYAYRALKSAVQRHRAIVGAVLVMDVHSGEILAVVNQPSFNPNDRDKDQPIFAHRRNRALIDSFEPGSTIKPFIVGALLENGHMNLSEKIQTSPGYYKLSGNTGKTVKDIHNFGELDLSGIIIKSSNVGISKVAMRLPPSEMWEFLHKLDFGQIPGTGFPGEVSGHLRSYFDWHDTDQAIMSYGYGLTVSLLQLARAYAAIANEGRMPYPTFHKIGRDESQGKQVFNAETARLLKEMLAQVVSEGTGVKAQVTGYTVAGKTGTTLKTRAGKYIHDYLSIFSGFAPVGSPEIVAVVVIDGASAGEYYGGRVAAPVFSEIVGHTLRILNVPEDGTLESYHQENVRYTMRRVAQ